MHHLAANSRGPIQMDSTPPRRRKFGPKVKTGCQTCKIRRVKCDEAKPACFRCTRTGRKCDGYLKDVLHSHSAMSQSLVLLQRPSTSISGSAEERRGFHYYVNNTARELSGYYDSSFWEKLLVQAAVAEPSLRHAVIGIGSLHKAFATQRLHHSPDHTDHSFAINQYTKAIGYLRRSLATGAQQPLVALMSCILFVHLHSGFKILRDLKKISAADEYIIAMSLAPAFTRLSIQAVLYIDTTADRKAFALEMTEFSERECQIPDTFSTVEEARDAFSQTTNCLFRTFYMFDPDLPFRAHVDILPLHAKYSKQLANWNIAYEKFMQKNNSRLNSKEIRGAAMLKVQYATAFIMSDSGIPNADDPRPIAEILNDRKVFMRYHNNFENIVKLSRSLISASEADSHSEKPAFNFSADLGIVGPLYYCCVKCPDYTLRLAAIELLHRCPRREGMWDSAALVQLIRGFWEIEARYEALKDGIVDNNGKPVALTDLLRLVLKDGMKWEWRWKEVAWAPGLADPHYTWAEILEDPTLASINEKDTNGP